MKSTVLLIILLITSQTKETITEPIRTWKTFPVPNEELASSYNMNSPDWTIFDKDGELYVTNDRNFSAKSLPFKIKPRKNEFNRLYGKQSIVEVDNGYLLGVNRGEWGGNLWWFSKDGKLRYEISNDIIVNFTMRDNRIFAIQGLAHLSSSHGSIIEIKKENDKWTREEYLALPSAPDGIDVYQDDFVIVTSNSLIKVDKERNVHYLIEKGFWHTSLYPTSLIVKDNHVFVGMRKGIFKYSLVADEQVWLMR